MLGCEFSLRGRKYWGRCYTSGTSRIYINQIWQGLTRMVNCEETIFPIFLRSIIQVEIHEIFFHQVTLIELSKMWNHSAVDKTYFVWQADDFITEWLSFLPIKEEAN